MRKAVRVLCLLIVLALISIPGLTASSAQKLKEVKLTGYFIHWNARPYDDWQLVIDELNKQLKQKINATLEVNFVTSADWNNKMPLVLASGEPCDLMTLGPLFYQEGAKGAFTELSTAMLRKYMPERYRKMSVLSLNSCKIDGKILAIPRTFEWFAPQGFAIRGDLRKKYNLPEVKDLAGLEKYMDTMLANEKGVLPYNIGATIGGDNPITNLGYEFMNNYFFVPSLEDIIVYNYTKPASKIKFECVYDAKYFLDGMRKAKQWADKGYWSKNAYASKQKSIDNFKAGASFVASMHATQANDLAVSYKKLQPTWEIEFTPFTQKNNRKPVLKAEYAIPRTSKNPERVLMFLELLYTDRAINELVEYGIEGKHYKLTNGKLEITKEGSDKFPPDKIPFVWASRNTEYLKEYIDGMPTYLTMQKNIKSMAVDDPVAYFNPDLTSVKTEVANLQSICTQYIPIIRTGAFENADALLKELKAKYEAAGIIKVRDELQRQWNEYVKINKLR